jgi:hypothetical protein
MRTIDRSFKISECEPLTDPSKIKRCEPSKYPSKLIGCDILFDALKNLSIQ